MSDLKSHIQILKKAQELDREIYVNVQRLEEIPADRERLKQELEAEKSRQKELEEALMALQLKQKQKEGDLAKKETDVKKLDGQLSQVKTNKEYSALQQEISSLNADNSLLEEEIIRSIDEVDAAQEEVQKEGASLKTCEADSAKRDSESKDREKKMQADVKQLKARREEILVQVDPEIRGKYDLIISKKQGIALAKIVGEKCGACQMKIRPQLQNEVLLGERIVSCEACHRFLYMEENEQEPTQSEAH